jgi:multiple sugar transport system ATP-binding protein
MAKVRIEDVHKTYPNGHVAARGIELTVADGELVVLVGSSGCGKSTVLRIVAGLETPTKGTIWIDKRDVTRVRVQDRDVAMVFQSYALYPHRTVRRNLAFALEVRGVPRTTIDRRIAEAARALELQELLDRKPGQLSGSQCQRVALGRAIVREPAVFLLDEPLASLDASLRVQTRAELARLHRRLGATMIYVTHDPEEAMTLGDRVAVLDRGHIQQCAPPLEVYRRPANAFVAGFVGSPAMNLWPCELRRAGDGLIAAVAPEVELTLPAPGDLALDGHRAALLGVRAEDVELAPSGEADFKARIEVIEPLGAQALLHLARDHITDLRMLAPVDAPAAIGDIVGVRLRHDRVHLFAASGDRARLG